MAFKQLLQTSLPTYFHHSVQNILESTFIISNKHRTKKKKKKLEQPKYQLQIQEEVKNWLA